MLRNEGQEVSRVYVPVSLDINSYHRDLRGRHEATFFPGVSSGSADDSHRGFLTEVRSCFAAVGLLVRVMDQ
jgi:hypothetical protein